MESTSGTESLSESGTQTQGKAYEPTEANRTPSYSNQHTESTVRPKQDYEETTEINRIHELYLDMATHKEDSHS